MFHFYRSFTEIVNVINAKCWFVNVVSMAAGSILFIHSCICECTQIVYKIISLYGITHSFSHCNHNVQVNKLPIQQRIVYYGFQLEHVITDDQIVLQSEWWQYNAITYGEGKSQIIVFYKIGAIFVKI